jgi:hypothetical protein
MSLSFVFGRSEGERAARAARFAAEDRLMEVHEQEMTDLSFHAKQDGNRNLVFITRLRDMHADLASRNTRLFWLIAVLGASFLAKGVISAGSIGAFLGLPH